MDVFTVYFKCDNADKTPKKECKLSCHKHWTNLKAKPIKYQKIIIIIFLKSLVSKLSLQTCNHFFQPPYKAFLFSFSLLPSPVWSSFQSTDYKMGHQRTKLYFYIRISHFLLSPRDKWAWDLCLRRCNVGLPLLVTWLTSAMVHRALVSNGTNAHGSPVHLCHSFKERVRFVD